MRNVIIILLILNLSRISTAQVDVIKSRISGKVIDIETQQPIPFVSIWLEGTTVGTISDEYGNYEVNNITVGR